MGSVGFANAILMLHLSLLLLAFISTPLICAGEEVIKAAAYDNYHIIADAAEVPNNESKPHHETPTPDGSPSGSPPAMQRKLVGVQGVVYCKPCEFIGVDTLTGATPLPGAVVKLQCNNSKNTLTEQANTDMNGYFFFMPSQLTTYGSQKCKASLVSSPLPTCGVPTGLHGGDTGASLVRAAATDKDEKLPFQLYNVGPFAFEPTNDSTCHY